MARRQTIFAISAAYQKRPYENPDVLRLI